MDAFGLSQEIRDKIAAKTSTGPADFILLEENWPAFETFLRCQTQWRYTMTGITGLDYTAVISVITLTCKNKDRKQLFEDVRLIEQGALKSISAPKGQ